MIDILLATYNGEDFVEEQVRSIMAQTFSQWRLLVHDDGSTDNTIAIIQSLAAEDSRIILLQDNAQHLGVAKHFIHMLQYAQADYCMFCDQDDRWLPNKVEKLYNAICGTKQDIPQVVYSNAYLWSPSRGIIAQKNTLTFPTTLQQTLFLNTGIQGSAAIFNRAMCTYLRYPLSHYAMHDHVLLLAGICFGEVHYLHEPLMYYRQHANNLTGNAPGSITKKMALMWQNRHVPLVSRLHLEGLQAFYNQFQQQLSAKDNCLIQQFLQLPNKPFLARVQGIIRHRFQLFDSTFLLLIKHCIRKYIAPSSNPHMLLDGTAISQHMDGLSQYILNVLLHWQSADNTQYTLLLRPNQCPQHYLKAFEQKNWKIDFVNISPIGPLRDWHFARYLRKHPTFTAAFIPSNQFPLALHLPTLYVIHDLIYEQFPEQLGHMRYLKRWYLRYVTSVGLRRAEHVVAVSQFTKNEILRYQGNDYANKITVIYEGWEHLLHMENLPNIPPANLPFEHYILYVGSSRGHKNWKRLIQAIHSCYNSLPNGWGFVFVGNPNMLSQKEQKLIQQINQHRQTILLAEWQGEQALANYFRHAAALIFPSLSEGFGIPILEAYFYRLPLLLSNQASLPEVAQDAAIYFNPYDVEDIKNTIIQFITHPNNHMPLIERQTKQLAKYSWKNTSKQLSQLLQP